MLVFRWKIFYFCIDNFPETLAGGEEPLIVATPALVIKASCKHRQYELITGRSESLDSDFYFNRLRLPLLDFGVKYCNHHNTSKKLLIGLNHLV